MTSWVASHHPVYRHSGWFLGWPVFILKAEVNQNLVTSVETAEAKTIFATSNISRI